VLDANFLQNCRHLGGGESLQKQTFSNVDSANEFNIMRGHRSGCRFSRGLGLRGQRAEGLGLRGQRAEGLGLRGPRAEGLGSRV